jgi:hypothetical protein
MTTESDENPYAAPAVAESLQSAPETSGFVRSRMNLHVAWLLAVLFNLPVPVMLGESAVSDPRATVLTGLGLIILSLMMGAALFAVFRIRAFDTQPYKLEATASEPQP